MAERKCPICSGVANSPHHIKPRAQGGTDDPKNIIWLCRGCHDEIELAELTLSPDLIASLRLEKLGAKAVSREEYWFINHDDGVMFIGIKRPSKSVEHYDVFFPYDSQLELIPPIKFEIPDTPIEKEADILPENMTRWEEEIKEEPKPLAVIECRYYKSCKAPLCPLDKESLKYAIWYPDEPICRRGGLAKWIAKQRKIAKVATLDAGFFYLSDIKRVRRVRKGIVGHNPKVPVLSDSLKGKTTRQKQNPVRLAVAK